MTDMPTVRDLVFLWTLTAILSFFFLFLSLALFPFTCHCSLASSILCSFPSFLPSFLPPMHSSSYLISSLYFLPSSFFSFLFYFLYSFCISCHIFVSPFFFLDHFLLSPLSGCDSSPFLFCSSTLASLFCNSFLPHFLSLPSPSLSLREPHFLGEDYYVHQTVWWLYVHIIWVCVQTCTRLAKCFVEKKNHATVSYFWLG